MQTNQIKRKVQLSGDVFLYELVAPGIAAAAQAGNFVIIIADEKGERIPLTIADKNLNTGTITIIFKVMGTSTKKLAELNVGAKLAHLTGPLGKPTELTEKASVVCIGAGIGIAPLYPIIQALKAKQNKITAILGAQKKEQLFYQEEIAKYADQVIITTDDGSAGRKGFVSNALEDLLTQGIKIDRIYVIGPLPAMRVVCHIAKEAKIPSIASLNSLMIDGTGMCGCCRVLIGGKTKFTCVDGPEFPGDLIDFENLNQRLNAFREVESESSKKFEQEKCSGACKIS